MKIEETINRIVLAANGISDAGIREDIILLVKSLAAEFKHECNCACGEAHKRKRHNPPGKLKTELARFSTEGMTRVDAWGLTKDTTKGSDWGLIKDMTKDMTKGSAWGLTKDMTKDMTKGMTKGSVWGLIKDMTKDTARGPMKGSIVGAERGMRMGTRMDMKMVRTTDKAEAANRLIEHVGRVKYNLFGNNCHMFTASCILGTLLKRMSVEDWFRRGTFSIDRLEEIISNTLNGGRPIAWLGVDGPTAQFDYALADEKAMRLRTQRILTANNERKL